MQHLLALLLQHLRNGSLHIVSRFVGSVKYFCPYEYLCPDIAHLFTSGLLVPAVFDDCPQKFENFKHLA